MRPEIKEWVIKHFVHLPTSTLPQFMDQIIHAEKVTQNKKKNREKKADAFVADSCDDYGEEMQMCFIWKVQAGTTGDEEEVKVSPEGQVEASPEEGEKEDFQI